MEEEIPIIVSSDFKNGAFNISPDGSSFEVLLEEPINIPANARNVTLSTVSSNIWWTIPNVITGQNDKLYISGPDTLDVVQSYVITIPQGLYDSVGLNSSIKLQLETAGAKISPSHLITLSADVYSQKTLIRFNYNTVSIDFTQNDTFRDIIGFNSSVLGPYASPITVFADNVASYNQVNYFLIHSDLTNKGIRFNRSYNQIISQVLIDVSPGSQIVNTPFNPSKINVNELIGTSRSRIRMWLTDDENRPVNTNSEVWGVHMVIKYRIPEQS